MEIAEPDGSLVTEYVFCHVGLFPWWHKQP